MAGRRPRGAERTTRGDQEIVAIGGLDEAETTASNVEPEYIERNRRAWDAWAPGYLASGRRAWEKVELGWGIWGVLESELELLSGIESGHDAIELGCGTAEISAWLARRGARPVAVDLSSRQIRNVETLQREYQLSFPLVVGNAEAVHYEDASFDVAISEYGASLWCDPQRWLPEAYRLLRPGAVLIFITNSDFLMACTPTGGGQAADRLMRDFFSQSPMEFEDDGPVEFHPTHGSWIRLLRKTGFVVEGLIEVQPPPDASPRYDFVTLEWARHWPSEEIWIARKPA